MVNWIQNGSGGGYNLDADEWVGRFDLEEDVVRELAAINRMKGSTPVFAFGAGWSVAIHSVACCRVARVLELGPLVEFALLRHDQHEAVTGDIPTPIAKRIGYAAVEAVKTAVQNVLDNKEAIATEARPHMHGALVRIIDATALHVERQFFMAPGELEWGYPAPAPVYTQAMYDVILDIITDKEHHDGGAEAYLREYGALAKVTRSGEWK